MGRPAGDSTLEVDFTLLRSLTTAGFGAATERLHTPLVSAWLGVPLRRERLLHLVQVILTVRATVQIRRVRPGEGRGDYLIGHSREKLIDLFGRLDGHRCRPVGRDRLQKRQEHLVEQFPVVSAVTIGARRPPSQEAESLAVPERDMGQGNSDVPAVGQQHLQRGLVQTEDESTQSCRLCTVARIEQS